MSALDKEKRGSIPMLEGEILEPRSGVARQMVVFLHGYGADGFDLISLGEEFSKKLPDCVFLSPHAPFPCEIAPNGRQWCSLASFETDFLTTQAKIAAPFIHKYIDDMLEAYDLKPKNLVIIGFSQGTIMGLYTALRMKNAIAGLIGFSGSSLQSPEQDEEVKSTFPVLLVHGKQDEILPYPHMIETRDNLKRLGAHVETLTRPDLGHGIDNEGVEQAKIMLKKWFS